MRLKLVIGTAGEVALPAREAAAAGLSAEAGVEWSALPGMGVAHEAGQAGGAWFAGTLGAASFAEVAQLVASGLLSGALHLAVPAGPPPVRKSVFFREGQVIFASSTDPADRLGPVLERTGQVPAGTLERCSPRVGPGRPLGQVLVEEGILTAGQLYDAVVAQVREIFLSAFEARAGEFLFRQGPPDERNAVRLPERTRALILAGLKRAEAAEQRAAAEAPAPASTPTAGSAPHPGTGDSPRRDRGEGDVGRVTSSPASPPRGPFEAYRRLLRAIHGPMLRAAPTARERLDSWFAGLPGPRAAFFEGVRPDAAGDMDVARVLANVERAGIWKGAAARAKALEALEGLLAFALFEARNLLPREEVEALRREVHRIQMGG